MENLSFSALRSATDGEGRGGGVSGKSVSMAPPRSEMLPSQAQSTLCEGTLSCRTNTWTPYTEAPPSTQTGEKETGKKPWIS